MSDPIPPLKTSIIPTNSTIIVGLSGGPDSVYLLHQLHAHAQSLNIQLIAAHLDHEWQESSKIAAQLCQDICKQLAISCIIQKRSNLTCNVPWNGSQEEVGRIMRRHFFSTIAQQHQAKAIALGHHQQDQQETFFIRLLRGSSITGLVGIKEIDGLYIRPILHCKRIEILDYLHTNAIPYYTDPTNTSDIYLRNRIRNHVIPALQSTDQRFDTKLEAFMNHCADLNNFLEEQVACTLAKISTDKGYALSDFLLLHTIMQQKILMTILITEKLECNPSQKLFKEIIRFLEKSRQNKHLLHNSWMIVKSKGYFSIKKVD